jgi:8-oxo-dGTP pyrophosphatase MutT (NUDIX family)
MGKNTQSQKTRSGDVLKMVARREFSSGGIVFKKEKENTLWLIRKTSKSDLYPKQYWMLPKGRIDDIDGDLPGPMATGKVKATQSALEKAALREVGEETGVEAKIIEKIGTTMYSFVDPDKVKIIKFVTFYLMEYIKDLPQGFDWETEEIAWLSFEEAKKQLSFGGEKQMLVKANELLASVV